jgi:hypothetical protein
MYRPIDQTVGGEAVSTSKALVEIFEQSMIRGLLTTRSPFQTVLIEICNSKLSKG